MFKLYTIALISHANEIIFKILQIRLQKYLDQEIHMCNLDLEMAEDPDIKMSSSAESKKKKENSRRHLPLFQWVC